MAWTRVDLVFDRANHGWMAEMNREEVDAKLAATEAEVGARLSDFNTTMLTGFADVGRQFAEMNARMAEMRAETNAQLTEIRAEMRAQLAEMRGGVDQLRAEMYKNTASLLRWGIGLAVAIVGTTVGATVGLLTYLR